MADIPRIDIAEVQDSLRRGEGVVFVDARSAKAWGAATEQIPGSHRILADEIGEHADELPPAALTVAYCT